ncbi:hypothetical protein [Rhizobium leguminosarum]
MRKYKAVVSIEVEVEIDEAMFTETFMEEFRESFYRFNDVQRHVEHIAQLEARGLLQDFTEGYGPIKDMGIKARTVDWDTEVEVSP